MAVSALIKFEQGPNTDVPGRAVIGTTEISVDITNGDDTGIDFWEFELLDVPPGSVISVGVKSSGASPTVAFTPDAPGCYRWRLTVQNTSLGQTDVDIRNFAAPNIRGWVIPSYQKNPDPLDLGLKPDELNFASQPRGWAGDRATGLFEFILDDLLSNGFGLGGVGGYLTIQDDGIALPQQSSMNFVGPGITASDDTIKTKIEIHEAGGAQSGTIVMTDDLGGTGAAPVVAGLQGVSLDAATVGSPNLNDAIFYDGSKYVAGPITASADATALRGINLDAGTVGVPSTGNSIFFDGGDYVAAPLNLSGGSNYLVNVLPVDNGGTNLSSLGTANQVLKVNLGGTDNEYGLLFNASISASANIETSKLQLAPVNPADDNKIAFALGGTIVYASNITTDGTNLTINGKLTVTGSIDPTDVTFEKTGLPPTGPNQGAIFVSDGSGGLVDGNFYFRPPNNGTSTNVTTGGDPELSDILFRGNSSGSNNIIFNDGFGILGVDGSASVGGPISVIAGAGDGAFVGGTTTIAGGQGGVTSAGGDTIVRAGNATDGAGGNLFLNGGIPGTDGSGGSVTISAREAVGIGDDGNINLSVTNSGLSHGAIKFMLDATPFLEFDPSPDVAVTHMKFGSNAGSISIFQESNVNFSNSFTIEAQSSTDGSGGSLTLRAGSSINSSGGDLNLKAGLSTNDNGGNVKITATRGNGSGVDGKIILFLSSQFLEFSPSVAGVNGVGMTFSDDAGDVTISQTNQSGTASNFSIIAQSSTSARGGDFTMRAGSCLGSIGDGGNFLIYGGDGFGIDGRGGNIFLKPGVSPLNSPGSVILLDSTNTPMIEVGTVVATLGFYNAFPTPKQSVLGSRASNAALESLLVAFDNLGLIDNSTTA